MYVTIMVMYHTVYLEIVRYNKIHLSNTILVSILSRLRSSSCRCLLPCLLFVSLAV